MATILGCGTKDSPAQTNDGWNTPCRGPSSMWSMLSEGIAGKDETWGCRSHNHEGVRSARP